MHADRHWVIDKKVPVAIIVALCVHASAFIWWASDLNSRVAMVENRMRVSEPQGERITRVEVTLETIKEGVADIKRTLQQGAAARPR